MIEQNRLVKELPRYHETARAAVHDAEADASELTVRMLARDR